MTDLTFRSDMTVELMDSMGDDASVIRAARVSTKGSLVRDAIMEGETVGISAGDAGLISFLMRNRHGTPFEHNSMTFYIEAPIFVWREFMRHRIGFCVAGSTQVPVGAFRNGVTKSVADIYRDWKLGTPDSLGRTRKLPACRNLATRTLNLETGLIESARMVDVYESGMKPVIELVLASGHKVRCTREHRIWTDSGWVKAGDLSVRDVVGRQGKVPLGELQGIPKRLRMGIQEWTTQQRVELIAPVDACHLCGGIFAREDLELDHMVPVAEDLARALDLGNLAPACTSCHQHKTNGEQLLRSRRTLALGVRFERVVTIEDAGEEMTYDIEMPAPWHNFIADGVVVHNSYNEESGRYKQLEPTFYVPSRERPLIQVGKPGAYTFEPGDIGQQLHTGTTLATAYMQSYVAYEGLLAAGIAKEVARMCLPVAIYSSAYVTCNARALMSFLSLRTKDPNSMFPSFPQREIEMVAEKMETIWAELMPVTHAAFHDAGRVSP